MQYTARRYCIFATDMPKMGHMTIKADVWAVRDHNGAELARYDNYQDANACAHRVRKSYFQTTSERPVPSLYIDRNGVRTHSLSG